MAKLGHLSFDVTDIIKIREFFDCLLGELGFERRFTMEDAVCYSNPQLDIWFARDQNPRTSRGNPNPDLEVVAEHTAILVSDASKVRDVERAMTAKGFKPLFPAQENPQFTEGYFSACFVGPDNIVFEVYANPKEQAQ